MQLITRKQYLNELIELYGTPDIKVLTTPTGKPVGF